MGIEAKFNAKQRTGSKGRAFVCRLTDGRVALMLEGEDLEMQFVRTFDDVKKVVALLVPEIRIPMYDEHELPQVRRLLEESSACAA
jgi:hypothetical protein